MVFIGLIVMWQALLMSSELLSYRGGIWRAYFVPTAAMWDTIHRHGTANKGGLWKYSAKRLEESAAFKYLAKKMLGFKPVSPIE